ncbi:hypothetical protein EK904_005586 [Melospiza melodia maxima]|nr:hypothetical protein EK904_005586 [Melospiza melodia maxima]
MASAYSKNPLYRPLLKRYAELEQKVIYNPASSCLESTTAHRGNTSSCSHIPLKKSKALGDVQVKRKLNEFFGQPLLTFDALQSGLSLWLKLRFTADMETSPSLRFQQPTKGGLQTGTWGQTQQAGGAPRAPCSRR